MEKQAAQCNTNCHKRFCFPAQLKHKVEKTKTNLVRRGVRSDAQLSSTETRFQKRSQSGKNGSKHPMFSISMAYNVISCKKIERDTQKIKIGDFTMYIRLPSSEMSKNRQKNGSLNRDLLKKKL